MFKKPCRSHALWESLSCKVVSEEVACGVSCGIWLSVVSTMNFFVRYACVHAERALTRQLNVIVPTKWWLMSGRITLALTLVHSTDIRFIEEKCILWDVHVRIVRTVR